MTDLNHEQRKEIERLSGEYMKKYAHGLVQPRKQDFDNLDAYFDAEAKYQADLKTANDDASVDAFESVTGLCMVCGQSPCTCPDR